MRDDLAPIRGIMWGLAMAAPFWLAVTLAVVKLV
jgi:hypothetical protein